MLNLPQNTINKLNKYNWEISKIDRTYSFGLNKDYSPILDIHVISYSLETLKKKIIKEVNKI